MRCGGADKGDHAGGVDDGAAGLVVSEHRPDGVLATVPDTFDVDVHGQVPDPLLRRERVVVGRVHDAGIVKHHIHTFRPRLVCEGHECSDVGLG